MWNEKKFFQDFVEESEKVKPDEEFVQQLKKMADDNELKSMNRRKMQVRLVKYTAVAASFLLCFIIGGIAWNAHEKITKNNNDETNTYTVDVHAGNKNQGVHSGFIGDESDLESVIERIGDENVIMKDENGEEISSETRKNLLKLLNKAEKADEIVELEEKYTSYFCIGEKDIEIKVYNREYIVIGDSDVVYRIN